MIYIVNTKECDQCNGWGYTNHDVRNTCKKCKGKGTING